MKTDQVQELVLIVRPNSNVNFTPVSKRVCMMKVRSNNNVVTNIINAYATILETTLKNSATTPHFYKKMSSFIKTFKTRESAIISGFFNTKTKSKFSNCPTKIISKY